MKLYQEPCPNCFLNITWKDHLSKLIKIISILLTGMLIGYFITFNYFVQVPEPVIVPSIETKEVPVDPRQELQELSYELSRNAEAYYGYTLRVYFNLTAWSENELGSELYMVDYIFNASDQSPHVLPKLTGKGGYIGGINFLQVINSIKLLATLMIPYILNNMDDTLFLTAVLDESRFEFGIGVIEQGLNGDSLQFVYDKEFGNLQFFQVTSIVGVAIISLINQTLIPSVSIT